MSSARSSLSNSQYSADNRQMLSRPLAISELRRFKEGHPGARRPRPAAERLLGPAPIVRQLLIQGFEFARQFMAWIQVYHGKRRIM